MKYQYIRILALTISLIVGVSCDEDILIQDDCNNSFFGSIENREGAKTILTDNGSNVLWEPGDAIRIFCSGQEGKYISTISSSSATSSFISETNFASRDSNRYFAIYPYSDQDSFDGTTATVTIPYNQYADKESFDKKAFVMMAESDSHILGFKNLCGGVKLSVTQDGVYAISIKGNNNETIAGKVKTRFINGAPVVQEVLEPQKKIVLRCPDGKCFEKNTWYYISCLPVNFSNGFTVELLKNEGDYPFSGSFLFDQSTTIQRSVWGRLNQVDDAIDYTITPKDNVIFYKTVSGELANVNAIYITNHYIDGAIGYNIIELNPAYKDVLRIFRNNIDLLSIVIPADITYINDNAFDGCTSLSSVQIPTSVVSIGARAFRGCNSLTSITIPEGIESIGKDAFEGCTELDKVNITSISAWCNIEFFSDDSNPLCYAHNLYLNNTLLDRLILPDGITCIGKCAFEGCTSLSSVQIPISVTDIGNNAFRDCANLNDITIPKSIKSIGEGAFGGCTELDKVNITSISAWCNIAFIGGGSNPLYYAHNLYLNNTLLEHLILPDGITCIKDNTFCGCTSLSSVVIPTSVVSIGESAFRGCNSLTSITIPESVNSIGGGAFGECRGLNRVTIREGVTSIGGGAFYLCRGLSSITIPQSVNSIGDGAFYGCKQLVELTLPSGLTKISKRCFGECGILSLVIPTNVTDIGDSAFIECSKLTSITIPEGVTSIGDYTFDGCTSLSNVQIPTNVVSIGKRAFHGCNSFTNIIIPERVKSIGVGSFSDCRGLNMVTIQKGVTSVGSDAFAGCVTLTNVMVKPLTPPDGGITMFDNNAANRKIYVPCESLDAYKVAAGWNEYASDIEGLQ